MFNIKYQSSVLVANFGAGFEEMPGNGPRGEAAVMSCSSGLIRYGDNLSHRKIPKPEKGGTKARGVRRWVRRRRRGRGRMRETE